MRPARTAGTPPRPNKRKAARVTSSAGSAAPRCCTLRISQVRSAPSLGRGHQEGHCASGRISAPSAPEARRADQVRRAWEETARKRPFVSPRHGMERASVHSASGRKKREQNRPVLGAGDSPPSRSDRCCRGPTGRSSTHVQVLTGTAADSGPSV